MGNDALKTCVWNTLVRVVGKLDWGGEEPMGQCPAKSHGGQPCSVWWAHLNSVQVTPGTFNSGDEAAQFPDRQSLVEG